MTIRDDGGYIFGLNGLKNKTEVIITVSALYNATEKCSRISSFSKGGHSRSGRLRFQQNVPTCLAANRTIDLLKSNKMRCRLAEMFVRFNGINFYMSTYISHRRLSFLKSTKNESYMNIIRKCWKRWSKLGGSNCQPIGEHLQKLILNKNFMTLSSK